MTILNSKSEYTNMNISGSSDDANAHFSDLHYKMCKKISQLTKVIFHLHTKTEDHEFEVRELAIAYENQIDNVIVFFFS
jgi:hypothetical protein